MSNISIVDICNLALDKVGAKEINSLDDEVNSARILRRIYPQYLASELRKHNWNFSICSINLAADVETPIGYMSAYTLPANCLKLLQVGEASPTLNLNNYVSGNNSYYRREGNKILINSTGALFIRYVAYAEDTTKFDSCFVEVLALKLAIELAEPLTQSSTKKTTLLQEYKDALRDAIRANAIELPPTMISDGSWMKARLY